MSKSYRDQKPRHLASRRLEIGPGDPKQLPRIVSRRPYSGDIHPLKPAILRTALRLDVPIEYLYGLTAIELRARQGKIVGQPYGLYRPGEKCIVLYSLPMEWQWTEISAHTISKMRAYGASVVENENRVTVVWGSRLQLAIWFFSDVLAHELGHHYRNQYQISLGGPGAVPHEECVAELHARRIEKAMRERRKERVKNETSGV